MSETIEGVALGIALLETGLMASLLLVGFSLARRGINGPCRLCLSLLLAWRTSVVVTLDVRAPDWDYLWGMLFAYTFLYATYHLAGLLERVRALERAGSCRAN